MKKQLFIASILALAVATPAIAATAPVTGYNNTAATAPPPAPDMNADNNQSTTTGADTITRTESERIPSTMPAAGSHHVGGQLVTITSDGQIVKDQ